MLLVHRGLWVSLSCGRGRVVVSAPAVLCTPRSHMGAALAVLVCAGLKAARVWCVCCIICLQGPGSADGWSALLTAAGHPVQSHARFTHEPRAHQPGCWRWLQPNEPGLQPDKSRLQPNQPDVQPNESRLQPNQPRLQPDQPRVQPNKPRLQVCSVQRQGEAWALVVLRTSRLMKP